MTADKKKEILDVEQLRQYNESIQNEGVSDKFIKDHMYLVETIAVKISKSQKIPSCIDFGDLISWGIEGLIKAKGRFDPKMNAQFKTYAYYRVRGEILDSLKKEWRYRLPKDFASKKKMFREKLSEFIIDNLDSINEQDSEKLMADNLIEDTAVFSFLTNDISDVVSERRGTKNPEVEIIDENFKDIWDEVKNFSDQERIFVDLYYIKGMKQYEIAEYLSLSKAKVSRLHVKIIEKLKNKLMVKGKVDERFI